MFKPVEKFLLLLFDFLAVNATFWLWAKLRERFGYFAETVPEQFFINALALFLFWLLLFSFYGLYRSWHAQSRIDEFIDVGKAVSIGVFLIFLITVDLNHDLHAPLKSSRAMIISYWLLLIINVGAGRLALRTFQRTLLEAGYGVRNALIVGGGSKAREVFDELRRLPALGYRIIGFVGMQQAFKSYKGTPRLGDLDAIVEIIKNEEIDDVIIAGENEDRRWFAEVVSCCIALPVRLKIVPDLYDTIIGQVRTHQIYGLPFIEVMPESMPAWERRAKRLFDIGIALCAGVFLAPFAVLMTCLLRLSSRAGILCAETYLGKGGKPLKLYRFCIKPSTETFGARFLAFLKSKGWDKIPLLFNVLKGDLSIIGPRAEPPAVVEGRALENPLYMRRFAVKPGLTGWAQIKSANGVRANCERALQYDFYYIENMSLRMDLKILLIAMYNALLDHKIAHVSQSYAQSICMKERA